MSGHPSSAGDSPLFRVEKGNAEPEELAAIAVVLLARTAREGGDRQRGSSAGARASWSGPRIRIPHSWQYRPPAGVLG